MKALLEQSEHHLAQEENRHSEVGQQLLQLTELKNALQQQADSGGSGVVTDKQVKPTFSFLNLDLSFQTYVLMRTVQV